MQINKLRLPKAFTLKWIEAFEEIADFIEQEFELYD